MRFRLRHAPVVTPGNNGIDLTRHDDGAGYHPGNSGTSGGNSSCKDCEWAVVPACASGGTVQGTQSTDPCSAAVAACPAGGLLYRIYFRPTASDPWAVSGTECLNARQAAARGLDIAGAAQDFFDHMPLPAPGPSFQPASGAVVNTATIFTAGADAAAPQESSFDLGGITVTVSATPAYWLWQFEPGVSEQFTSPGGGYPNKDVTYTYHSPGTRTVTVTTVWKATYTAPGGTAAVAGEVSRTSPPLQVPVYEARSQLVSEM